MRRPYAPIVPGGRRAARDAKNPKIAFSLSLTQENFDWCVEKAKEDMVSLSCFIDGLITVRRSSASISDKK